MIYNLGSILLGLLAWILSFIALARSQRSPITHAGLTTASFSCCALSLCLQIMEVRRLVDLGNWSSLMDTQGAVVFAAVTLLAVTAVLNALVWLIRIVRKK